MILTSNSFAQSTNIVITDQARIERAINGNKCLREVVDNIYGGIMPSSIKGEVLNNFIRYNLEFTNETHSVNCSI